MRFVEPAGLGAALPEIAAARECVVACGAGAMEGDDVAALLLSDYAILEEGTSLRISSAAACERRATPRNPPPRRKARGGPGTPREGLAAFLEKRRPRFS